MIETVLVVWTFHTTQSVSTNTAATIIHNTWFLKIILIKKFDCTLIGWAWPCLAHPWIRHCTIVTTIILYRVTLVTTVTTFCHTM